MVQKGYSSDILYCWGLLAEIKEDLCDGHKKINSFALLFSLIHFLFVKLKKQKRHKSNNST